MEALKSGDETALRATLTRQAQEQTARKLDLRSNDRLEFTVAQAESHGDLAEVPVSVYRAGEREEMTLRMRRDSGEWRIYALGIRPSPGAPEVTLDLEHPDVELSAAFREVGEGVGAALRGVGQGVGALLKDVAAGVREIRSAAAGH